MRIIAIYPGRFQPFGSHHKKAYEWLLSIFGKNNTFIVTSDKVELPKSPLQFKDKKLIMQYAGVPPSNIIQVKNPYISAEVLSKYDPDNTAVVFMYGQKDAGRLLYSKKDGSPGYFQLYKKDIELEPFPKRGYVIIAPHFKVELSGFDEMSGTNLRKFLANASPKDFKDVMGWYNQQMHKYLITKFSQVKEGFLKKKINEGAFVKKLEQYILDNYGVELEFYDHGKYFELLKILVPKHIRNTGIGSDVMEYIITYSNKKNKPIYLTPDTSFGGTSITRLKSFYKKFGFVKNKDFDVSHSMVRYPILDRYNLKDESMNKIKTFKSNNINEILITEGGAAGHLSHIYEDSDLTFSDLKEIVRRALGGKLDVEADVTEKTDGMNLFVTYVNGEVKAARNKTTILSPLSINDMASKFEDRGAVRDAFVYAMKDLKNSFDAINSEKFNKIFKNGKVFINIEVIYPEANMTIIYGPNAYIQMHGLVEFDEDGRELGRYPGASNVIYKMIQKANANTQTHFNIIPPQVLKIGAAEGYDKIVSSLFNEIQDLQGKYGLTDNDRIVDYYKRFWGKLIEEKFKITDEKIKNGLVERWSGLSKSFMLTKKNIPDDNLLNVVKNFEKTNVYQLQSTNIKKFEDIILKLSFYVLKNTENLLAVSSNNNVRGIRNKLVQSIRSIRSSNDVDAIRKLYDQIRKINLAGGIKNIKTTEGIVFMYNGRLYKITGSFAPLNQILGMIKYKK